MINFKKKILSLNRYKDFNELENIKNNRNLIFLIKKKQKKKVLKIFFKKDKSLYFREISGYKNFKKFYNFKFPNLYFYNKYGDFYLLEFEFINGKKPNFFEFNNIFNLLNERKYKFNLKEYLNKIKYKNSIKEKLYNFLLNNIENIFFTKSHGDFVSYNILKLKKNYFLIDFEKFRNTSLYYDRINFLSHPIFYHYSKITIYFKSILFLKKFENLYIKFFPKLIFVFFNYSLKNKKLKFNDFKCYYLLYLFEKIENQKKDLKSTKSKIEKRITKKHIYFMNKSLIFELYNN